MSIYAIPRVHPLEQRLRDWSPKKEKERLKDRWISVLNNGIT